MQRKTIYIGADSAGYAMKESLITSLREEGYEVVDCGAYNDASSHYPEFAHAVCEKVQENPDTVFGILVCGTGIGMSMAANKHRHIRAALCGDTFSARFTRLHNNANVLCLGARVVGVGLAKDIVDAFLDAPFESGGRHEQRVNMITAIEENQHA